MKQSDKSLRKTLNKPIFKNLAQFIKFCIVGVSNTVVAYLINIGVILALKPATVSWDYVAANIVSFILSVLWSFYWNNKYVFSLKSNESRTWYKALLKTYVSYAFTGIILNNILSWLWISQLGISKFIAPILNAIIGIPINFLLNKLWAFRKS
jgi:putative flippase GtrA